MATDHPTTLHPVATINDIMRARELASAIYIDSKVEDYIVDVVFATRDPKAYKLDKLEKLIAVGASPRGRGAVCNSSASPC